MTRRKRRTPPRGPDGRFRRVPRRNPVVLDFVIKPAITAAAGHVGTEAAKGAIKRARKRRKRS